MNLFSLFGAVVVSAFTGGLNVNSSIDNAVTSNIEDGQFQINLQCNNALTYSGMNPTFNANNFTCVSSYYYWAETGIETSGTMIKSRDINPLGLDILKTASLPVATKRIMAVVDNTYFYSNSFNNFICAIFRQYVMFDFFHDKTFNYGVRNYGGYADSIATVMYNNISGNNEDIICYQGFVPLNFSNSVYLNGYIGDEWNFNFNTYFESNSYTKTSTDVSSQYCPFTEGFTGYTYNTIINNNNEGTIYGYQLPYYYVAYFGSDDANLYPYTSFIQDFNTYNWSFNFYGNDFSTDSYQEGYNIGYQSGNTTGYQEGYNNGQNVGYDNGYRVGYDTGVLESNDYSFISLFGAIADTPVLMIRSLFDFDFFGINLLTVVLSLFTGLILFYLLRKLL